MSGGRPGEHAEQQRRGHTAEAAGEAVDLTARVSAFARAGDQQTLHALVIAVRQEAMRLATRRFRKYGLQKEDVDDIAQEVAEHALRTLSKGELPESLAPDPRKYIQDQVHNAARRRARRQGTARKHQEGLKLHRLNTQTGTTTPLDAERAEELQRLRDAMSRLTEEERELLELTFHDGLTAPETVKRMELDLTDAAVRKRLERIRKKLKAWLTGPTNPPPQSGGRRNE